MTTIYKFSIAHLSKGHWFAERGQLTTDHSVRAEQEGGSIEVCPPISPANARAITQTVPMLEDAWRRQRNYPDWATNTERKISEDEVAIYSDIMRESFEQTPDYLRLTGAGCLTKEEI